jgi:hypothetical protein
VEGRDYIDRRLRAANRVPVATAGTATSEAVLDRIGARIVAEPVADRPAVSKAQRRSRQRFPVARRGVVLGSVIGVLAVGGAAAATVALTGAVSDGASGSCQALMSATANVPYPAGDQAWRNWTLLISPPRKEGTTLQEACNDPGQRDIYGPAGPKAESIPIFQGVVAQSAFCAWAEAWLSADQSGDTAGEAQAANEIAGALQWPASRAFLQPNTADGPLTGGPGMLSWLSTAQQAVQAGNVTEVASMFASSQTTGDSPILSHCSIYMPPANSDNGTVAHYPGPHAKP